MEPETSPIRNAREADATDAPTTRATHSSANSAEVEAPNAELALLTRLRRDLHRIPELGFALPKTTAYIKGVLEALDCTVIEPCESTVCAFFDFGADETVAIRADMDALPVAEQTGVEFASRHPGQMHACGHDGHMAMALALANSVAEAASLGRTLPRNVLLVFQPAEETTGGAKTVCESGVFERFNTTRIFGYHLWPDLPAGAVASRPGALLARASETTLTVQGKSSHIAKHEQGCDALLAAARFTCAVNDLMARLREQEPCLLKFGRMESGTVRNAISAHSVVEGSLRVFSDSMFEQAKLEVEHCAQEACESCGCTYDLHFAEGYPPVINDARLFAEAAEVLLGDNGDKGKSGNEGKYSNDEASSAPGEPIAAGLSELAEPLLIAEDFAFYQQHLPGLFMLLGTGTGIPLHADTFNFDERVLLRGLQVYRRLIGLE